MLTGGSSEWLSRWPRREQWWRSGDPPGSEAAGKRAASREEVDAVHGVGGVYCKRRGGEVAAGSPASFDEVVPPLHKKKKEGT